jgi:HEAT repeat protein
MKLKPEDKDPKKRPSSSRYLALIRDGKAIRRLARLLRGADVPKRRDAAWALGEMGDPGGIGPLARALGDPDDGVRENAARALGRIGDRDAVAPLIECLRGSQLGAPEVPDSFLDAVLDSLRLLTKQRFRKYIEWRVWLEKEEEKPGEGKAQHGPRTGSPESGT